MCHVSADPERHIRAMEDVGMHEQVQEGWGDTNANRKCSNRCVERLVMQWLMGNVWRSVWLTKWYNGQQGQVWAGLWRISCAMSGRDSCVVVMWHSLWRENKMYTVTRGIQWQMENWITGTRRAEWMVMETAACNCGGVSLWTGALRHDTLGKWMTVHGGPSDVTV